MAQQFQGQQIQAQLRADKVLDTQGLLCPMPVIQASGAIKDLAAGQYLKILATDPGSKADFPAWAESLGHRLVSQEDNHGVYVYWVQKG